MSTAPFSKEQIDFLKENMAQWLAEQSLGKPPQVYEIELRERMVRVEEELKHQRDMIQHIIDQMDKRFDQVDKRFEQMERRFEQMEKRFEQMDHRFEALTRRIDRLIIWFFSTTVAVGGIVVGLIKFL